MTQTDETTKVPHARFDLSVRIPVHVPLDEFERAYGDPTEASIHQVLDVIGEDTDRMPDALMAMIESGDFDPASVDVEDVSVDDREPAPKVEFNKPRPGQHYTPVVPNFISGNVRFTDEGIEEVAESAVNKLDDQQVSGAMFAVQKIWGLRGMHRYQQEQIAEFASEVQWATLARPALHYFKPGDFDGEAIVGYSGGDPIPDPDDDPENPVLGPIGFTPTEPIIERVTFDPNLCHYCGKPEGEHLQRKKS